MKTLHIIMIISITAVTVTTVIAIEVFFQNPPHGGYMLVQTDTIPQKNSTHICLSKKDQAFDPGPSGAEALMCPIFLFHTYTTVIDYSDFDNVCVDKRYDAGNYVLNPGHSGSITYKIYPDIPFSDVLKFPNTNITNHATFVHYKSTKGGGEWNYTETLDGVSVSFEPKFELLWPWSSSLVTVKISTLMNAKEGSHWLILSPGVCGGGPGFILTIDNSTMVN